MKTCKTFIFLVVCGGITFMCDACNKKTDNEKTDNKKTNNDTQTGRLLPVQPKDPIDAKDAPHEIELYYNSLCELEDKLNNPNLKFSQNQIDECIAEIPKFFLRLPIRYDFGQKLGKKMVCISRLLVEKDKCLKSKKFSHS